MAKKLKVVTANVVKTPVAKLVPAPVAKTATPVPSEPKAPAAPKERAASKFVSLEAVDGKRMRVSEYQDHTFTINDAKGRRLTDEELATDWRKMFPQAVAFTAFHVGGARRDFNKGIHSKAFPGAHDAKAWFAATDGTRTQVAPKGSAPQETPKTPSVPAPLAKAADAAPKATARKRGAKATA